jgi:hypothetical protein
VKAFRFLRLPRCVLAIALGLGFQACAPTVHEVGTGSREPVCWILVERRYGNLEAPPPSTEAGTVNPDAVVLAFQPLYREDLTWEVVVEPEEHFVELVSYSPSGPVAPGEVVSATVRVGKSKAGQRYRLLARASHTDVRLIGHNEAVVKGEATAVFRFTRSTSGRGGIEVGVNRMEQEDFWIFPKWNLKRN